MIAPRPVAYLDHAATSPVRPEVAEAMAPFATERFGNPSGSHRVARDARRALEEAREAVAECLGAAPAEVVFTSGGTEGDNLAVLGSLGTPGAGSRRTVVCSAVEHAAVLESCRAAGAWPGIDLAVAPVGTDGAVDLERLEALLVAAEGGGPTAAVGGGGGGPVALVSVMAANNEVGTVQPLDAVVDLVRRCAPEAVLHTDAVQAARWHDLAATAAARCDLVTVSAHKLGGPKGAGALVVRHGRALGPLLFGGGQESERRSGTSTWPGRSAWPPPCGRWRPPGRPTSRPVRSLRDRLADGLLAAVPGAVESAPGRAGAARPLPPALSRRRAGGPPPALGPRRRVRRGRVGLRQRGPRPQPRAGGHGGPGGRGPQRRSASPSATPPPRPTSTRALGAVPPAVARLRGGERGLG